MLVLLTFCFLLFTSSPANALVETYNPAFLITDEEFNDTGAMSCEQIQAFLNARKGVLKTYAVDGKPAAQIICESATRFSVNPRLLLMTMQKEMGLLTDTEPTEGALNWAMGAGRVGLPQKGLQPMSNVARARCVEILIGRGWGKKASRV